MAKKKSPKKKSNPITITLHNATMWKTQNDKRVPSFVPLQGVKPDPVKTDGRMYTLQQLYDLNKDLCEKKSAESDNVNHPSHYNQGKIEVIEMIEDQQLGYHLGCAVKYIMRAGKKDSAKTIEDLEKALWYVRRKIETLKPKPRRPNEMPQERA